MVQQIFANHYRSIESILHKIMKPYGWTDSSCSQDELAESVDKDSSMLHDEAVLLVVSCGIPGQLNHFPEQSNLASVCVCVCG